MTQTTLKPIVLSILLISAPILSQAHETEQSVDLEEVTVVGKSRPRATSGLLHASTASDKIISGDTLRQKAVNLGDALDGVPGIHASQYGGGASAPVIRGQTGRRIKVLNHHGETGDMAALSCLNPTTETSLIIPPMVAESSIVAFAVAANATAVSVAIIFIF